MPRLPHLLLPLLLLSGLPHPAARARSPVPAGAANPHALPEAHAIMRHLRSLPARADRRVISGQFESWDDDVRPLADPRNNLARVHAATGRWVGLAGVEYYMRADEPHDYLAAPNRFCREYWRAGGLVQIYVIPRNPAQPDSPNGGGRCDLDRVLTPGDAFNRFYFAELDRVAAALAELRRAGVVVFLNPLAEIDCGWFWWSDPASPGRSRRLYRATVEHLVRTRGLDNLLLVFEPSRVGADPAAYYPGDDCVDVVGISCFLPWDEELGPGAIPAYPVLRALGKPLALSQWGPRRGADQVGRDEPPADNRKLIAGIRRHFPEIVWWMNWNFAYALAAPENGNTHARELLADPWVANRGDGDWRRPPGDGPNHL